METTQVLCRREGRVGRVTLNRPRALNALNLEMIRGIHSALTGWLDDPDVEVIVLDGAGERGFCAGGDITVVHESARTDHGIARRLWREEYALDALIASYPLPVVGLMDGITMGGGIGLTGHASVRVVTERSVLAMPEVAIGLAPDVAGSLLLARAPGELGTHLALTAGRIGARDALVCGLADHYVPAERLPALTEALRPYGPKAADVVAAMAEAPPAGAADLADDRSWIDACYAADSAAEILGRLRARPEPAAAAAAEALLSGSPTAVEVTLRALREARSMATVAECLVQDYRLSCRFLEGPDLPEGIRAAVIDKDRSPRWSPASLTEVTPEAVDAYFAPLGPDDLRLSPPPAAVLAWSDHSEAEPTRNR
ncbi:enoyl-CoA hydratase/isomerase family protein [Streptomyces armeniacus]|uniref:3-hydroxyisobutyryl-CoA hydrolase n=1 Tax=Streptomyces armeniacus TaxID=83291 RepID=A0A345XM61_9ACTN|nr:enoyl-CoA hydratase/isomerase family protein [Streptomyces armeniacus]AXK32727.1 enoyl-CoA hydratase/isomerase family protein [Streptomyces armeniacus]